MLLINKWIKLYNYKLLKYNYNNKNIEIALVNNKDNII
jgi:hypothetical protein